MLNKEQIDEIKKHLEKAQNPLFYYDNDADGLCSFILIRRFIGRGKGIAVRGYPDLNKQYAKRARELNADYIFVLDNPMISEEFLEEINNLSLPVVWIDHHDLPELEYHKKYNLSVYNPNRNKIKSSEPTSYLCYKITERKEDEWIALIGCISDHYLPEFAKEFEEEHEELWGKGIKHPFDAYYKTEIGKIAQAFNFGLKDSVTNVVKMQNFLIKCRTPNEAFVENSEFVKKYKEIRKKLDVLIEDAKDNVKGKLLFFEYAGNLSISSELANELSYNNQGKYIVVAYKKGAQSNISIRGKKVKQILAKIIGNFENANGGGHEDAVGARINTNDLNKFKEMFEKEI